MAVAINGTSGISGIDGSSSSPTIRGTDSNTGLSFAADTLICNTGGNERTRINSNGELLIGCTTQPSATVHGTQIQSNGLIVTSKDGTSSSIHHQFFNDNGSVGQISTSGTSTTYSTSSDYRLKENAVLISDGITRLKTLKPYRFNFKSNTGVKLDGFFAHEVTAVPEAITGSKDEVDLANNPVYQTIDQSKLVPLLTAALQEAVAKIETLETKVAALEAG